MLFHILSLLLPTILFCQKVEALDPQRTAAEQVKISSCHDGDTCTTSKGEKIRLACIQAAELHGPRADPVSAKASRDYLRDLVVGKTVLIQRLNKDQYGRTVAELFLNGSNLQQQMVAAGYAEIYWKYAAQCAWTH